MKGNTQTLVYAALLGIGSSLLMGIVGYFTLPFREANAKAEKIRQVLQVLNVPCRADAPSRELLQIFDANIRTEEHGGQAWYLYFPAGAATNRPAATAIHFDGKGVWGPIKGFLALDADLTTIRGVTFYQQEETPGLGSEIESAAFRARFVGKSIRADGGEAGIRILAAKKGLARNEVDAIAGATMTCKKVETILNDVIAAVQKEARP